MSDNIFVGQRAAALETAPALQPVSKVVLLVDDSHYLEAGNDTGRTLELTCPYATQAMADALLAALGEYRYRPLTAQDALLDPAAELGDGVTIGGVYSVAAALDWTFDGLFTADIAAPGPEEIDSEYQFTDPTIAAINRKIAETRSSITKTAEQIRLEVQNQVQGLSASVTVELNKITQQVEDTASGLRTEFTVSLNGVTSRVEGVEGSLSTLEQTAASLSSRITGVDNQVSSLEQYVDSLTLSVSNGRDSSTIELLAGRTTLASQEIYFRGMVTFEDLETQGSTIINGGNIDTDTLRVRDLYGQVVNLYTDAERRAGSLELTGASTADYAVELSSRGALRLTGESGHVYIASGSGTDLQLGDGVVRVGDPFDPVAVVPSRDGVGYLGTSRQRWNAVYASTGTIQTSDRNAKHDMVYGLEGYDGLFDALRPVSFRFNQNESNRIHLGLCAQDVEAALGACGVDTQDFAGFIKSPRADGGYDYALRYSEFLPLCIEQIQKLKARVDGLERSFAPWKR